MTHFFFYRLFTATTFWLDLQKYRLEILEKDDLVSKTDILLLFDKSNVFPRLNVNLAKYYINKMKCIERLPSCHNFKVTDLKSFLISIENVNQNKNKERKKERFFKKR